MHQQRDYFLEWLTMLDWSQHGWSLYTDFGSTFSPHLEKQFEGFLSASKADAAVTKQLGLFNLDSVWVVTWMGQSAIAALVFFGGFALIERKHYGQGFLTVGTFYALLSIFSRFVKS